MVSFAGTADSSPTAPYQIASESVMTDAGPLALITTTSPTITGAADASVTIKTMISMDNGTTWTEQTAARTIADDNGNWETTVVVDEGVITGIAFKAVDSENSESSQVVAGYVMADVTAPTITISSPAEDMSTENTSITITGSVTKDNWEAYSDLTLAIQVGTNWDWVTVPIASDGSFSTSANLSSGMNIITATVADGLNTPSTASVNITRTAPPTTTTSVDPMLLLSALVVAIIAAIILIYVKFGSRPA